MKNYVKTHLHTDFGNGIFIDSATKYNMYIDKAVENGMSAIAFTEHGSVFSWVNKKLYCDKKGLKYIHGIEIYVSESLDEKIRDNYHCCLYARNWQGVLEINKLSSISFNRNDNHFYYVPRISFDELINTSNNVIISTACTGGILYKGNDNIKSKLITFLAENKDRCFLEIQHHIADAQAQYNKYLYKLSKEIKVPLIVGTDTHSLNKELSEARSILQKSKNIYFEDEGTWDLNFKTYDELVDCYKKQNSLPMDVVLEAIDNTNKLADMVEEFSLDTSKKYPKLFVNSHEVFKKEIVKGFKERGFDKLPPDDRKEYQDRITYEYKTYKKNEAIDFMLLQKDIMDYCYEQGIYPGYSRGSVSGSEIAYLLKITEADSIKWGLNFERFMNTERISLADIDTDFPPSQRDKVKKYVFSKPGLYCCDILTHNTIQKLGAIRDVARALNLPLDIVNEICKNIEVEEEKYRKQYPELFKFVDLLIGVVVSVGSHPCGSITSPYPLDDLIGLCTTTTDEYPISQINMKEIDYQNFVKLDLLGLDNIEIINKTCELAGIERLTPDNVDIDDEQVWDSILESSLGVFQWEGAYAWDFYKKLFNPDTIKKIKDKSKNFSYINLFSMGNGALRPAGSSYRDQMCQGIFKDNGHEALNDFLEPTMGYLVYQEQIIEFLNQFCGFTMGEADIVRRGFAKKTGTDEYIPKIENGFIQTMKQKYNMDESQSKELIKSFIQVIIDASFYLFSLNHSLIYSFIGYICSYLRFYHTKAFLSVMLNINKDDIDKTGEIIRYANSKNIKILPIKFRMSRAEYSYSEDGIYKGIESIKFCNSQIAEELYQFKDNQYNDFYDLLVDIKQNTSCNSKQLHILTSLNFFSEFGKNKKLLDFIQLFDEYNGKKQIKKSKSTPDEIKQFCAKETEKLYKEFDSVAYLKYMWNQIEDKSISIREQVKAELEYLGYIETVLPNIPDDYYLVLDINDKYTPRLKMYKFKDGTEHTFKIYKKTFNNNKLEVGDIIRIYEFEEKQKSKLVNGEWIPTEGTDIYARRYGIIRDSAKGE